MKEKLDQIKKEVESELRISYDDVTKSNEYILKINGKNNLENAKKILSGI